MVRKESRVGIKENLNLLPLGGLSVTIPTAIQSATPITQQIRPITQEIALITTRG